MPGIQLMPCQGNVQTSFNQPTTSKQMKSTHLSSPAHTQLLRFHVHSSESGDAVEIIETLFKGDGSNVTKTQRWLSGAEASNYRAKLIRQGWTEYPGQIIERMEFN